MARWLLSLLSAELKHCRSRFLYFITLLLPSSKTFCWFFGLLCSRRVNEPPLVVGWIPFVGKAVEFGRDAHGFLLQQQKKLGDVFTVLIAGLKSRQPSEDGGGARLRLAVPQPSIVPQKKEMNSNIRSPKFCFLSWLMVSTLREV